MNVIDNTITSVCCYYLFCCNTAVLLISDPTVRWLFHRWWTVTAGHRHCACLTSRDCGAVTLTQRTLVVNFPLVSVISAESLFQPTPHSCFYCRCLECQVEAATTTRTTTATRETKRIFLSTGTSCFFIQQFMVELLEQLNVTAIKTQLIECLTRQ